MTLPNLSILKINGLCNDFTRSMLDGRLKKKKESGFGYSYFFCSSPPLGFFFNFPEDVSTQFRKKWNFLLSATTLSVLPMFSKNGMADIMKPLSIAKSF